MAAEACVHEEVVREEVAAVPCVDGTDGGSMEKAGRRWCACGGRKKH
jgi:hypothetical protein